MGARTSGKVPWTGTVLGIQPRIRLTRSFDQASHSYQGYVLRLQGELGGEQRPFIVALGKGAQEKHTFRVGDAVSGMGEPVADPETEVADLYKVSGLAIVQGSSTEPPKPPPWLGMPPTLEVYRARGHRRLDAGRFVSSCPACMWGCEMAVEIAGVTPYSRTYTNTGSGATGLADPATVSGFRLDKYLVTVGRFRQFVDAVLPADGGAGWLPPSGSGKHTHLNGGLGLAAGPTVDAGQT